MIAYIKGKIINKGQGYLIVLAADIGYKVFVSQNYYLELGTGDQVELYTYQNVREDALDLYGFKNMDELEMFELLLSISGIGPKSALGATSIASVNELKDAIAHGDPTLLTKVSGIGKKTAERVVLELREKVSHLTTVGRDGKSNVTASGDEIDALMTLGYSLLQAREALKKIDPKITSSGERIREALKNIGK